MVKVINKGSFQNTENFLKGSSDNTKKIMKVLERYGQLGVSELQKYTPVDTGKTAMSWRYEIKVQNGSAILSFHNDNITKMGIPVAVLLQYGHATKNGYWIDGIDYINPALEKVFNRLADDAWREVTR